MNSAIKHMETSEFNFEVMENETIVITMKPKPEICCVGCVAKFLLTFVEQLKDSRLDKPKETGLH